MSEPQPDRAEFLHRVAVVGLNNTGTSLPVADIQVGTRHRREKGDIEALAQNIADIGLLHPIVVTPAGQLIAGERRLRAYRHLGRERIPATVIAWGFEHRTILTWVKDRMGCGDWLRGQTEHCLMAVRGEPVVHLTNQTTVLHGPLRANSQKPDEFFAFVERLCPATRYAELFSRRAVSPLWDSHGDQAQVRDADSAEMAQVGHG